MLLARTQSRWRSAAGRAGFRLLGVWLGVACLQGTAAAQADNQIRLNRPAGDQEGGQPLRPTGGSAPMTNISPQETLRIFQSAGFDSVRLTADEKGGTDYLRLRAGDNESFLFHMNCSDGRCRSLMFMAFLNRRRGASLNFVNDYNVKTLHTKMARNAAGEIVLTMAASLDGGVTAEHLRALGPFWERVHRDALAWK